MPRGKTNKHGCSTCVGKLLSSWRAGSWFCSLGRFLGFRRLSSLRSRFLCSFLCSFRFLNGCSLSIFQVAVELWNQVILEIFLQHVPSRLRHAVDSTLSSHWNRFFRLVK